MNQTRNGIPLATTSTPKMYEVLLDNGDTWRGTKRQLLAEHPDWLSYAKEVQQPTRVDEDDDRIYRTRLPNSARRYDIPATQGNVRYEYRPGTTISRRRSAQVIEEEKQTEDVPQVKQRRQRRGLRAHPILYLGIGMILMLFAWVGITDLASWWTNTQNDWTYTKAFRTYSVDFAVGHNHDSDSQPSHFIVQNDKRHVIIIEFPADDMSKALIYIAPTLIGDGQERTPVTLSFQRNPQTGRLDLVLHIEDQQYVFTNNGTKFVPPSGQ